MNAAFGAKVAGALLLTGVLLLSVGITGKVIILIIKYCSQ